MNKTTLRFILGLLVLIIGLSSSSFGQYNYTDNVAPSITPPGGLKAAEVPQFVVIGFDDASVSGEGANESLRWIIDYMKSKKNPAGTGNAATYDGTTVTTSFYCNTTNWRQAASNSDAQNLKKILNEAYLAGFEIGNHTWEHMGADHDGWDLSQTEWEAEIKPANDMLIKPAPAGSTLSDAEGAGIPLNQITGFRTPYLEYGANLFPALKKLGFVYDCSIEEGYEYDQNGTNFYWPYTLDNGSPVHNNIFYSWAASQTACGRNEFSWQTGCSNKKFLVPNTPGLWELANHCYIVPPDNECAKYGIPSGLRAKIHAKVSWFDVTAGKMTGFDYNMFGDFGMTKAEALATLKYTFDLRYNNNRAPLLMGAHPQYYTNSYWASSGITSLTLQEAKEIYQEFIDYVISKPDARMVSGIDVINWMRNPVAIGGTDGPYTLSLIASNGTAVPNPQQTTYVKGTQVTITATPATGYAFTGWSGSATSTANPLTITMDANKIITANFSVIADCNLKGDLHAKGTFAGTADATSTINATPTVGSNGELIFNWTQAKGNNTWPWVAIGGALPSGTLAGLCSIDITYKSDQPMFVSLPQPPLSSTGESYRIALAASTTVKTVNLAVAGFAQPSWATNKAALNLSAISSIMILPQADASIAAATGKFEIHGLILNGISLGGTTTTYNLTTNATNGSISKSPNQTSFTSGATVTLTATANNGYTFTGWSGDATGTTNPLTVTMDANKTITANFTAIVSNTYNLTTNASNGTISKSPNQTSFTSGATVTLTATANNGYTFTGWSGDATGTTNPLTVTMDANKTITANFTAIVTTTYNLITNATYGTISKSPNQTSFTSGATVTLTATANNGYTFTGWSGDVTGSTNPVTITMNSTKTVTANFTAIASGCNLIGDLHTKGSYYGIADALGSTINATPTSGGEGQAIFNWSMVKMTGTDWPWVSAGNTVPSGDLGNLCSIEITYKSDQEMLLNLDQPPLSDAGESYQVTLPVSSTWNTLNFDVNQFAQPSWATATALNLAVVKSVSFAPSADASTAAYTGTLEIKALNLHGVDWVVSVNNTTKLLVDMSYPNPAKNDLYITLNNVLNEEVNLQVLNLNGQEILSEKTFSSFNKLNVSSLSPGVYLLKVTGNNISEMKKIVIN